ncbi:MAG: addiction module protein [Pseudomonadota bacterium]|nr:addiction module protein [Pseudomonadota bacterium]
MIVSLPLEEMSIVDKISTMEILWDDICRNSPDYPSPAWHGEILQEREENICQGKDKFEDWEEVKKEIWNSVT